MANDCKPQVQACAMRVSRLEANGVPDPGTDSLYVTDSPVFLQADPVVAEGTEFETRSACDEVCLSYRARDKIKRWNVEMDFCKVEAELYELLAGGIVLNNGTGKGWGAPHLNEEPGGFGVSIELWAKSIDSTGEQDADFPYNWWILPRVYLRPGTRRFENGPFGNPFSGYAIENPHWYDGPANDFPEPTETDRPILFVPTTDIPAAVCGYQLLEAS